MDSKTSESIEKATLEIGKVQQALFQLSTQLEAVERTLKDYIELLVEPPPETEREVPRAKFEIVKEPVPEEFPSEEVPKELPPLAEPKKPSKSQEVLNRLRAQREKTARVL